MKQGIVWRETEGLCRYQGWPSVCCDENGILYAVASGKRMAHICPFGKTLMYISRDGGESWSSPVIVNDTVCDDRDAGILSLGKGRLLVSWFDLPPDFYFGLEDEILNTRVPKEAIPMTKGLLDTWRKMPRDKFACGSFVRLSQDGGATWSQAYPTPVSSPHGPSLMRDGSLLYMGKLNVAATDGCNPIGVCKSCDDGKTWTLLSQIPMPEGLYYHNFHEPYVLQLPDGGLLGAIRAQGREVHEACGFGFTVYLTRSADQGKTWTVPEPTGVFGAPPHLLLHSSGAVIMVYAKRDIVYHECAKLSRDGGFTWSEEIILNDESEGPDLGYPSTAELPDGSLITVYYQKLRGDSQCSILYTKWSLPNE